MTKNDWFWGLLGFVFIGAALYGSYEMLIFFLEKLSELNPNVAAAIISGMATVIGGAIVVLIAQGQARRRSAEESHRNKKVEIYKRFLEVVSRIMADGNKGVPMKAPTEKELAKYIVGFKTELILWASPKVIKAQLPFQYASKNEH